MTDKNNCHRCKRGLSWLDLKNFSAKTGNFGLKFYGGYLCQDCLEKAMEGKP